jgi:glycine oxidase
VHVPDHSFDLVVVGAGAIGLTVAWRAASRGRSVLVLERDTPGHGSSWAAAGMLAPVSEAVLTEQPLLRLGLQSAAAYRAFVAELEEASGHLTGYRRCGSLLLAQDADAAEALARELEVRSQLGLSVRRLRGSQARALEPALAPALRLALEIPDDHAIDPRALTAALVRAVTHAGGVVRPGAEVVRLTCAADARVSGVELAGRERVVCEAVVLAAGAWGVPGLPEPARVPVRPVKGQIMRLHDPSGPGLLTRVVRMRGGYVVPRGDGRYVIGATMEDRGFDTTVTAGAVHELLRDAAEVLPGVFELVLDEVTAGLRPATPDNAPVIGPGALEGLHWASGHLRNGILLAPVTAELVLAGLDGAAPDPHFAADRFAPVAEIA